MGLSWGVDRTGKTGAQAKGVKERFAWAPTVRPEDITRATARREEIARRLAELLEGPTVLALPSAPGIAVPRNSPPEVLDDLRVRALALLCIAGLARLPQISLPLATLDGCPLGLSLIAARGNDTLLLELAARLKDSATFKPFNCCAPFKPFKKRILFRRFDGPNRSSGSAFWVADVLNTKIFVYFAPS